MLSTGGGYKYTLALLVTGTALIGTATEIYLIF